MSAPDSFSAIISILPLFVIFIGLFGNLTCFVIFRFSNQFNTIPSMVFLSFLAIFDTISLFEWNLNHFLGSNFGFRLEFLSLFNCKFFVFLQVYSLQVSGLLLSIMCIDRFVTVNSLPGSIYSRLPFSSKKSSYIWSSIIIVTMFILNCHILIFNGNFIQVRLKNQTRITIYNGTSMTNFTIIRKKEKCYWYTSEFRFYPTIDHINLIIYNFVPFIIMIVFNFLLIRSLMNSKSKGLSKGKNSNLLFRRRLTISILTITFAFIIMTMPSSIAFGFFSEKIKKELRASSIFHLLDTFAFMFHSCLFINCFTSNAKFRKYCIDSINSFSCWK